MKATLLILFCSALLSHFAHANSIVTIDITTNATGVAYALNDQPKTLDQLVASLPEAIQRAVPTEAVVIRPNERTAFRAVWEVLYRLKDTEAKHYRILLRSGGGTVGVLDTLSGSLDGVSHHAMSIPQPTK